MLGFSHAQAVVPPSNGLQCGTSIYGAWVINEGESVVNIQDCDQSAICGKIVKFVNDKRYSELTAETAIPLQDQAGPLILDDFRLDSDNKYKGRIFNPRNGKNYKSTIKVSKNGDLKVKGCLGPVCEAKTWTRPKSCTF